MSNDIAIRIQGLGKRYKLGQTLDLTRTFRETLQGLPRFFAGKTARAARKLTETHAGSSTAERIQGANFWALRDIDLEIKQGESIGVIGRNGAGKSTLLKILSRITAPTAGTVELHGRVGALLEIGTGFHQELTGRENIYLNGALLGMSKLEIKRKFDEIVDFSGAEQFLDTPVKRYSSGMRVRLGFAVAAHLQPEILIVDEVLSVGDAEFQRKCLGKMDDVARDGRTILFVSHHLASVENICPRSILLDSGRLVAQGPTHEVIDRYIQGYAQSQGLLGERQDRRGDGRVRFETIQLYDAAGQLMVAPLSGKAMDVKLGYSSRESIGQNSISVSISISDVRGGPVCLCSNEYTGEIDRGWSNEGSITCRIPNLLLIPGSYSINVYVAINGVVADWVMNALTFDVHASDFFAGGRLPPASHGNLLLPHGWMFGSEA